MSKGLFATALASLDAIEVAYCLPSISIPGVTMRLPLAHDALEAFNRNGASRRVQGMKLMRGWVPDPAAPGFREEARRPALPPRRRARPGHGFAGKLPDHGGESGRAAPGGMRSTDRGVGCGDADDLGRMLALVIGVAE